MVWHSNIVTERVSSNVVKTVSGSIYVLVGKMDMDSSTRTAGDTQRPGHFILHTHWFERLGHLKSVHWKCSATAERISMLCLSACGHAYIHSVTILLGTVHLINTDMPELIYLMLQYIHFSVGFSSLPRWLLKLFLFGFPQKWKTYFEKFLSEPQV